MTAAGELELQPLPPFGKVDESISRRQHDDRDYPEAKGKFHRGAETGCFALSRQSKHTTAKNEHDSRKPKPRHDPHRRELRGQGEPKADAERSEQPLRGLRNVFPQQVAREQPEE